MKQINIYSIQHQNYNGHWHHLASSLAESFNSMNYETRLICPTEYSSNQEKYYVNNSLNPLIGKTPNFWNKQVLKSFIAEIRTNKGYSLMYDGRIPLLLLTLIASRKMEKGSTFYLNLLGGSIERRNKIIDFRYLITKLTLLIVKSQDRIKILSESQELQEYIKETANLETIVFPVFAPTKFKKQSQDSKTGNLIILERTENSDYAISEITKFLSMNESQIELTVWTNTPNKTLLESQNLNRDKRLKFAFGYLDSESYDSIMQQHFRHIYVYSTDRYQFGTSGKLMESISLNKSLVVPDGGTFPGLVTKFYGLNFRKFRIISDDLVSVLLSPAICPNNIQARNSDQSVKELEVKRVFNYKSKKRISVFNYLTSIFLFTCIKITYRNKLDKST